MANSRKIRHFLMALVCSAALTACDGGALGPDGDDDGPAVPNVAGQWFGTFGGSNVSLQISQSGSRVTGTFVGPQVTYAVEGTVSPVGLVVWSSEFDLTACDAYASPRGLSIGNGGTTLSGPAQRTSRGKPCTQPGGRVLVQQDLMSLSRG